jgi:geranylgeranyl pyrophosphate synthase
MREPNWPSSQEVHAAARQRLEPMLAATGGLIATLGRQTLSAKHGLLSDQPHSLVTVLVPGTCLAAHGDWHSALWPAVGAELMMGAADLFDDAADADPAAQIGGCSPAVLLTVGAGLLSLASAAVARAVEDGVSADTATALERILGEGFAEAVNGQAANLEPGPRQVDALTAYHQAAAKSGPLGSLIARLGARTATADPEIVSLLGEFGRRLAVRSQLLNDARDAAPESAEQKADVRAGARTVPLAFTGSSGAPAGLADDQLQTWELHERRRIAVAGGLAAAQSLAEAERARAIQALDQLDGLGCATEALRQLA